MTEVFAYAVVAVFLLVSFLMLLDWLWDLIESLIDRFKDHNLSE